MCRPFFFFFFFFFFLLPINAILQCIAERGRYPGVPALTWNNAAATTANNHVAQCVWQNNPNGPPTYGELQSVMIDVESPWLA